MGDIKRLGNNLLEGEKVVLRSSVHWAVFIPAIISTIVFIIAAVMVDRLGKGTPTLAGVASFSIILAIIFFFKAQKVYNTSCVLTTMRLIQHRGSKTIDIPLYLCENVSASQGALGKLFGYGTIVATDGDRTIKLSFIESPFLFRDNINQQIGVAPTIKYEAKDSVDVLSPSIITTKKLDDSPKVAARINKVVGWIPTKRVEIIPYEFVINDNTNRFAVILGWRYLYAEFGFEDIISSEIQEGKQVITVKKSVSATGALAGGLIGGGLGAVIGGVGLGRTKTKTKLSDIVVHVLLRRGDRMALDFVFDTLKDAYAGMDLFSYAIDKADTARQNIANQQPISAEQPKSKINDLKDLAELYTKGLISEEEYKKLKSGLLE